jgi:voltage-gated potassium channel
MFVLRTILSFLRDKEYRELLFTTLLVLLGGSMTYHYLENWSWVDSIYFSVVTLTTVGFGDFAPKTDGGKIFTIFYIIIGIGIILSFINTLYEHYRDMRK